MSFLRGDVCSPNSVSTLWGSYWGMFVFFCLRHDVCFFFWGVSGLLKGDVCFFFFGGGPGIVVFEA